MKQDSKFDLLRLLACLMVIAMHAPLPDSAEGNGLFLSTLSYLTAPCIGLFFMVSGALLLPVRTGASIFLKRRFGKILFPTLFWSLFYLGCNTLMRDESIDWLRTLGSLPFSPQGNPVLWFMYTLIGLYLLAPVLSRWLNYASRTEIEFYLGLWGISLCFPIVRPGVNINTGDTGILYYFTGYAGYFVLGYYLKQYPKRIPWKALFPLLTVAMAAPVVCKTAGWKVDFYDLFWYLSVFVAIQCVSWYRMAECIEHWQIWLRMRKTLTQLSSLSFGIYLIHIFIMRYLLWQWEFIRVIDSYIVQTTIVSLLTFAGSVLASYLISFLPGAQYIIGHTHYESTRLK